MRIAIIATYILAFVLMIMWLVSSRTYEAGIVLLYGCIALIRDIKATQVHN